VWGVLKVLQRVANYFVSFLVSAFAISSTFPSQASAQEIVAKEVSDPQAHLATILQMCLRSISTCVRDGFVLSFGEGARDLESLAPVITAFGKTRAENWVILSDTSYSDTVRWIYSLVIGDDGSSLFFRGQFSKVNNKWLITVLDVNSSASELFIPLPPGGVQVPITHTASRPR
jgi:hypothetical protein